MGKFVQSYDDFETGQNADVDTAAEVLTSSNFQCNYGIYIKAEATNANDVFVGRNSSVTTANGFRLDAGEEVFIPFSGPISQIYVIGGAINQQVSYLAI